MFYAFKLWIEDFVPWSTRGQLRDERDHAVNSIKMFAEGLSRASDERRDWRERAEAAEGEIGDIRSNASRLETNRIAEHEALRKLMFGMSHNLEGSLKLINDFIVVLPNYTPDGSERSKVFEGLNEAVVTEEEQAGRMEPRP